jgi:MFS family permease
MKRIAVICLAIAVALAAVWVQACRLATRPINPDEHQFIASAVLFAREGKLPYVDYPYMHLPHQTLALGGLYWLGPGHLLLTARIMNATFGLLTLALVAGMVIAAGRRKPASWGLGLVAALALLFNPLFAYTSGLAWNHDGSVFLFLCSVAALWRGFVTRRLRWIAAAGMFLGLAIGVRSTIMPLALPMAAALAWQIVVQRTLTSRALIAFIGAGVAAQIPTLVLAVMAPERFFWGNFGYALLNTRLREDTAFEQAMSLREKFRYLRAVVFPWNDHRRGDLLLLVWAIVIPFVARVARGRRRSVEPPSDKPDAPAADAPPLLLMAALVPFALLGSLLPTPSWVQYYYVCIPLLTVAAGCTVARSFASEVEATTARSALLIAAISIGSLAMVAIESARKLTADEIGLRWPATVVPIQVHEQGVQLSRLTAGRVLTIDPIYAFEGDRPIFSELASGAYAYRVARFMPADKRKRMLVVGPEEIAERLAAEREPPALLIREPRVVGERLSHEDDEAIRAFGLDRRWLATPLDAWHTLFRPE